MKKNKWFGWAFVAIMIGASFSACTNETEEFVTQNDEIKLTNAITPASRTNNTDYQTSKIIAGQGIGITITGAKTEHNNVRWIAQADGSLANTGNKLYWGDGNINITAYHPYNANWTGEEHNFSVQTNQYNDNNYLNSDLLWIQKTSVAKSANPIELKFEHKLSKIIVYIEGNDLYSDVSICGTIISAKFKPSTGEVTPATATENNKIDIKVSEGSTSAAAIIIPQTVSAGTKFIKVEHNNKIYYYTLGANKTFEAGKAYIYTLTLTEKGTDTELTLTSPEDGNIADWNSDNNNIVGDAEENNEQIDLTGKVIIENLELSQALLNILGSEKVAINNNGYAIMSEEDINDINDLNFSNYQGNITTLNGIEHFVNLEYLDCGNRPSLTTCDFSQNRALISFGVTESSITHLDFSNNPNLKAVHCNGNEDLGSLNLTGCTQLSNLQIFSTEITTNSLIIPDNVKASVDNLLYSGTSLEFDLEQFPKLIQLGCTSMALNTEDLYNLIPESIKGQLVSLICDNNQLTTLDLSKFPNLVYLSCYNNYITSLDPSPSTKLRELSCYNNQISSLDITENDELTLWHCGQQKNGSNQEVTLQLTLTSTQKALMENPSNQEEWWGNDNINLIESN